MQHQLADHPKDCFVAVLDGAVVGYVTMTLVPQEAVCHIGDLAVDARVRDRGIGRRLLEHALAHFRAHGVRLARIATLILNEVGRHLFPSVGFVEVACQIHFTMPLGPDWRQHPERGEQQGWHGQPAVARQGKGGAIRLLSIAKAYVEANAPLTRLRYCTRLLGIGAGAAAALVACGQYHDLYHAQFAGQEDAQAHIDRLTASLR